MNELKKLKIILYGLLLIFIVSGVAISEPATDSTEDNLNENAADSDMDDFFELSPAELANTPIEIASGSARPATRAAGVTTVITADQIKAMGATDLNQVLETVPGFHVSIDPLTNDPIYSVRGIRNSTGAQVLVLLDGTRLSVPYFGGRTIGFRMPTQNIQRVEVIRGPGSAVYGADAFAGVVNIISKNADEIDGTVVGGRVGNFNSQSGWGQHGGTWVGWDVAASLQYQRSNGDSGRIIDSDSQSGIDSVLGTAASRAPGPLDSRFELWNAQLGLKRRHWDLKFWASNQNDVGVRAGIGGALDPNGFIENENYLGDVRFSSEDYFDDLEFQAHLSYLYSDVSTMLHLFPQNALLPIGADGNLDFVNPAGLVTFTDGFIGAPGRTQHVPSIELTGIYNGFTAHSLRLSAGYRYESIGTNERKNFGPGVINGLQPIVTGRLTDVSGSPFVYLEDRDRSIWSVSVQDEWSLAPAWLLTAGLRYDYYSDFGSTLNPRVALVWSVTDELTTKLLYGRAFRAPSFAEQATINNPVFLGNSNLDPETINTVELAFEFIPETNITTGLNLYYYQISDLIQPLPDAGATTVTVQNAGDQAGYGFEIEWDWQIIDRFGINGNYAWQYSRDQRLAERVAGVPEHQLFVASDWTFLPHWLFHSQLNWVGQRFRASNDSRERLEDYATVDLTLRRRNLLDHVDLAASVQNLFDEDVRETGSLGLANDFPLPGRFYYFEASFHF